MFGRISDLDISENLKCCDYREISYVLRDMPELKDSIEEYRSCISGLTFKGGIGSYYPMRKAAIELDISNKINGREMPGIK